MPSRSHVLSNATTAVQKSRSYVREGDVGVRWYDVMLFPALSFQGSLRSLESDDVARTSFEKKAELARLVDAVQTGNGSIDHIEWWILGRRW